MRRPRLLLIPAAGLAALTLVGCGDSSSAPASTDGRSAQQILSDAATKTAAQDSYRVALTAKLDADVAKGAGGQVGAALSEPLDISGEGTVRKPGDVSFDLSTTIAKAPIQLNITKVGDRLYISVLGQALELATPKGSVKSVDPMGLPSALAGWITSPQVVGDEDLAGVPTVHIKGDVDAAALTEDLGNTAKRVGAGDTLNSKTLAQADKALQRGTVDIWVGTQDGLIHGADADIALKGKVDAVAQVSALAFTISTRFSDFGTTTPITAPKGAKPLDLDNVTGLLGG
ncbi:MAG: hypothetical protein ACOYL4_02320 [Miltoncostaeaceae bacterium]